MTKPNDPAFSRSAFYHPDGGYIPAQEGMTIREYFAAMAMQAILTNDPKTLYEFEPGKKAVKYADALIAALNESQPTK